MGFRVVSLIFFLGGVAFAVWYIFSHSWHGYAAAFCWFVSILTFLISLVARRGSTFWRGKSQV